MKKNRIKRKAHIKMLRRLMRIQADSLRAIDDQVAELHAEILQIKADAFDMLRR